MIVKTPDVIAKHLVNAIGRGELGPGDRLPTLVQLASTTGTSVLSVREAIASLAAIGLVEVRHGKGVFLTRGAPIVEDLLEARRALESAFALRAAESRSRDLLQRLGALVGEMERHRRGGDTEAYSEADLAFHYAIAEASGNRILVRTLVNVRNLLRWQLFTVNRLPGSIERTHARHREILRAIRDGDGEGARMAMWSHLTELIARWQRDVAPARAGAAVSLGTARGKLARRRGPRRRRSG